MRTIFQVCRGLLPMRKPSPIIRNFSTCNFPSIDSSKLVEEESLPSYNPGLFYPVHIGEVLKSQYKIIGKLGYGDLSTIWCCRDLVRHQYVSMKICTTEASEYGQESRIYDHLRSLKSSHPGQRHIRPVYDTFELSGPYGLHSCLVHPPMHLTLLDFMRELPGRRRLDRPLLRLTLRYLLSALDFLHTEANVVHTDLKADNIMLTVADKSVLGDFCQSELNEPSPRKVVDDTRTIYTSRKFRDPDDNNWGPPLLCDFGEARIGKIHTLKRHGEAQPHIYRAPEVTFMMPSSSSIDIWNVANLIWDLFEDHHLFNGVYTDGEYCPYKHMAKIVAFLGPPPAEFVGRSEITKNCVDSEGNWIANEAEEIPSCTLETAEGMLKGKEKAVFLQFIRSMLRWLPEDRKPARELLLDPWLNDAFE